jgi:ParB/RepB/Spo0J family partition protein
MKHREIFLDQLHYDEDRVYGGMGDIDLLAQSMQTVGLLNPITVRINPISLDKYEQFTIVAGRRRYEAAKKLGWEEITANIIEDEAEDFLKAASLAENVNREDMHPLDEAAYFDYLLQSGSEIAKLARQFKRKPSEIYQRIRLLKLSDDIKRMFFDGGIELAAAAMLSDLNGHEQELFYKKFKDEEVSLWEAQGFFYNTKKSKLCYFDQFSGEKEFKKCKKCSNRTNFHGNGFFPEFTDSLSDVCFDDACYQKKITRAIELLLEKEKAKNPNTKNIIVFDKMPKIADDTIVLNGETYEVKKQNFADRAWGSGKNVFHLWYISGYADNIKVSSMSYEEKKEKTEEDKKEKDKLE